MFPEKLKQIFDLIKKTGDRVIVFNPSIPDDAYVLMDFDAYHKLAVDNEIIKDNYISDSHSRQIIRTAQVADGFSNQFNNSNDNKDDNKVEIKSKNNNTESLESLENSNKEGASKSLTGEDLTDKINREISMLKNEAESSNLTEENKPRKAWEIPGRVKNKAQEID